MESLNLEIDMHSLITSLKRLFKAFSLIFIGSLLWACETLPAERIVDKTPTISVTDVNNTAVPAVHTLFAQTMTAVPTSTVIFTDTLLPPTPTRTPVPFQAMDGLRAAYIMDGNLYVQDSGRQAIQLAHTGKVRNPAGNPVFTDDGQKIIFFPASESQKREIYSINADGTGERELVTSDLLLTLDLGYDEITESTRPVIVPGTHQMLFGTQQINSLKESNTPSTPNMDLLIANIDTGAIKQLLAIGKGGNFLVSPDGKLVAVRAQGKIMVITTQGKIVYQTPFTYSENPIYGSGISMSWAQDSRELIIVSPIPTSDIPNNRGWPLLYTIWRHDLDDNSEIEVRLNPPPIDDWFRISPDGNWIVYSYQLGYPASVGWDPGKPIGIYLGNLRDGSSKILYAPPVNDFNVPSFYHSWSPDSTYFIVEPTNGPAYIGNIHGEMARLGPGLFAGWIDNNCYLLSQRALELLSGEVGKQDLIKVMENPSGLNLYDPRAYIFYGK